MFNKLYMKKQNQLLKLNKTKEKVIKFNDNRINQKLDNIINKFEEDELKYRSSNKLLNETIKIYKTDVKKRKFQNKLLNFKSKKLKIDGELIKLAQGEQDKFYKNFKKLIKSKKKKEVTAVIKTNSKTFSTVLHSKIYEVELNYGGSGRQNVNNYIKKGFEYLKLDIPNFLHLVKSQVIEDTSLISDGFDNSIKLIFRMFIQLKKIINYSGDVNFGSEKWEYKDILF